jgi:hypothetical protein
VSSVIELPAQSAAPDLRYFLAFVDEQGMGGRVDAAQAQGARRRDDLGITSLEIIMLIANYMSLRGADTAGFKPEWVTQLDDVAGIVLVMAEIDRQVGLPRGECH